MTNQEISASKNYFELTPTEHEAIAQQSVQEAIEMRHAKGLATVELTVVLLSFSKNSFNI